MTTEKKAAVLARAGRAAAAHADEHGDAPPTGGPARPARDALKAALADAQQLRERVGELQRMLVGQGVSMQRIHLKSQLMDMESAWKGVLGELDVAHARIAELEAENEALGGRLLKARTERDRERAMAEEQAIRDVDDKLQTGVLCSAERTVTRDEAMNLWLSHVESRIGKLRPEIIAVLRSFESAGYFARPIRRTGDAP